MDKPQVHGSVKESVRVAVEEVALSMEYLALLIGPELALDVLDALHKDLGEEAYPYTAGALMKIGVASPLPVATTAEET